MTAVAPLPVSDKGHEKHDIHEYTKTRSSCFGSQIQLGLGQTDAALDWLERAADERHMGYYMPSIDPHYEPVRAHPRFRAILRRIHLGA